MTEQPEQSLNETAVRPFVIALDGPAASGKSSVGLGVARQLGLGYFDTGLLYRVVTWLANAGGIDASDGAGLTALISAGLRIDVDPAGRVLRDGVDITAHLHQPRVDVSVSQVSAHTGVRDALRHAQRGLIRPPGLVMAGRDIGTVIVPDAQLKIWLTASVEERARRRAAQTGEVYADVLATMQSRDALDGSRKTAPMTRAPDAFEIDTDGLDADSVVTRIVDLARAARARPAPPSVGRA